MNNQLTTTNLPQHLLALAQNTSLQSINQDAIKGISSGSWPRISLKGGYFRLQDPQGQEIVVPERHLDVVIVAVNTHGLSKIWYSGSYDPAGDGTAPGCYSDNGVAPSSRATSPQSSTCAACPHNVWGSKITPSGAQVKACADIKKVAVLLAANTSGPVFELRIPAASLSNWGAYVRGLDAAGIPAASIITRLSFDTAADYPKLVFGTPVLQQGESPYITPDMLADVMEVIGSNEVNQCTGENDKPITGNAIPPQPSNVGTQAAGNAINFGPPRAPLVNTTPPPPRTPHVSAPPLSPRQVGVTPSPNPAFPHAAAVPAVEPVKRTRTRKTADPAQAPLPLPPTDVPSFLHNMPNAARDASAPVSVAVTDSAMDDLLARAMQT